MTLKEFLLTVKMGYNNIVITESDDESFGTNNISNGRYLCVDSNVWFAETGEDILKYCPQMPKDWLDRRVTEINAITDMDVYKKFFNKQLDGLARSVDSQLRPIINVSISPYSLKLAHKFGDDIISVSKDGNEALLLPPESVIEERKHGELVCKLHTRKDFWSEETLQKPLHTNMESDYFHELLK